MNTLSWVLIGVAVLAAAVAIQAGNNLQVAVPAGTAAVLLVAVVGATELQSRSSRFVPARRAVAVRPIPERVESDSLLRLRRSFRTGEIGRSAILATVRALERDLSPTGRSPLSFDAEREVLDLPPQQFRKWVEERIARIEATT